MMLSFLEILLNKKYSGKYEDESVGNNSIV